jgi:hypothetical protein
LFCDAKHLGESRAQKQGIRGPHKIIVIIRPISRVTHREFVFIAILEPPVRWQEIGFVVSSCL